MSELAADSALCQNTRQIANYSSEIIYRWDAEGNEDRAHWLCVSDDRHNSQSSLVVAGEPDGVQRVWSSNLRVPTIFTSNAAFAAFLVSMAVTLRFAARPPASGQWSAASHPTSPTVAVGRGVRISASRPSSPSSRHKAASIPIRISHRCHIGVRL